MLDPYPDPEPDPKSLEMLNPDPDPQHFTSKHDFCYDFSCSGEESDLETEEDPLQLRGGEAAASDSGEDR